MKLPIYRFLLTLILFSGLLGCKKIKVSIDIPQTEEIKTTSLIILGTVQDGGSPHIACTKECCMDLFDNPDPKRRVVSIGLIDPQNEKSYIFDATPDFHKQMKKLKEYATYSKKETPDAVFLTHAHIGHYTGLMYLGKEAMGSKNVPVYAMPRMETFLVNNGPWSQLVSLNNISLKPLKARQKIVLTSNISVEQIIVPHRDEYSETVGFTIYGPHRKVLFIPDIDKWEKWSEDIIDQVFKVDLAFLDGTFFDGEEINNRDISEIPHPFIIESMEKFKDLPAFEKSKIYFIHLNHTNPVLNRVSKQAQIVLRKGFNIAEIYSVFEL